MSGKRLTSYEYTSRKMTTSTKRNFKSFRTLSTDVKYRLLDAVNLSQHEFIPRQSCVTNLLGELNDGSSIDRDKQIL